MAQLNIKIRKNLLILATGIILSVTCSTQPEEQAPSDLLSFLNESGKAVPVKTVEDWSQKRNQILNDMESVMGILPARSPIAEVDIQFVDSLKRENYTRYTVHFLAAENEWITAYLYVPDGIVCDVKIPAMLALHETDSLGKGSVDGQGRNLNLAYAHELAQRGYIVIAPDYPSFGESQDYDFENDRYVSGTMKGIFNHIRCIDLLESLPIVDKDRIGVIGHSLGGHNSIFVGAFDTRLKVVISSCGWTGFDYYNIGVELTKKYGGRLGPWAQDRYMPLLRDKYHLDETKVPIDFDEIIAAIAPKVFFSNSPVHDTNFDVKGVQAIIGKVKAVYDFLHVPQNLHVYYPEAGHDFPPEIRHKAYALIDSVFQYSPVGKK